MMIGRLFSAGVIGGVLCLGAVPGFAEPVQYVKVCDSYGAKWFYVPQTTTCLNSDTGETRTATSDGLVSGKSELKDKADKALNGVAVSTALSRPVVEPGHNFAISGDWGQYQGNNALGVGAAIRANENLTFSGSAAVGTDSGDVATRAGFNLSW